MKRPWMPLYIADYLKDTTHLGALESGAYLHLIMDYWQNERLPDDDKKLARIARLTDKEWKTSRATIHAFFHDGWKHKRIDGEIKRSAKVSDERRKAVAERERLKHLRNIKAGSIDPSFDPSIDDTYHSTQEERPIQGKTLSVVRGGSSDQ